MDLGKLLDDCSTLESIITNLISGNTAKQARLDSFKNHALEVCRASLDQVVKLETRFRDELGDLSAKKAILDSEINGQSKINSQLNQLVTIASTSSAENNSINASIYHDIYNYILEFEEIKSAFQEVKEVVSSLSRADTVQQLDDLVDKWQRLQRDLDRNTAIIRVLEQQNKYAEQQFDLILNQLPWKPMSQERLTELCESDNQSVRKLGENLQIQSHQITKLNESLIDKKKQKLEILDTLWGQLDTFLKKREEAQTMRLL